MDARDYIMRILGSGGVISNKDIRKMPFPTGEVLRAIQHLADEEEITAEKGDSFDEVTIRKRSR